MSRIESFAALAAAAALTSIASPPRALANDPIPAAPAAIAVPDPAAELSGHDIYERVLRNRFRSYTQETRLVSSDRIGRQQETRLEMYWQDFRDANGEPTRGLLSKTLVKYTHPFDLRYSGYLILSNHKRVNDQFVYYPSRRQVVRVSLRKQNVYGTDFSFEDVVPPELEDAAYERLPDEALDGLPVFVVKTVPDPLLESIYSRFLIYVDQERFVPLRVRYWDGAGVEFKELRADPTSIQEFDGVWVATNLIMRNLLLESSTRLVVGHIDPNPDFHESTFSLVNLQGH